MKSSTFYDVVRIRAKYLPKDSIALVFGDRRITWKETFSRINRLTNALKQRGIKKGDKVGILFHNNPEFSESNIAIQALGAVPVPINYRYVADELEFVLDNCDACCLIYETEAAPVVEDVRKKLDKIHTYISNVTPLPPNTLGFETIIRNSPDIEVNTELALDDIAVIIYTGGTTGRPKGVMLTYRNMLINQISVVTLLLRLLPPVSQMGQANVPTNQLHRKLLGFVSDIADPLRDVLAEKNGKGPIVCMRLTGPDLTDLPVVTACMVQGEIKLYQGLHANPDLIIDLDLGEEYRTLSDQGIYNATLKGKMAFVPIMIKRMLKGQMKVSGNKLLLLKALFSSQKAARITTSNMLPVPPLFHLASYALWLTFVVHQKGWIVFPVNHSFDPQEILDLLDKEKIIWTLMVPVMWKKVVAEPNADKFDLSSLKIALSGAAVLPAAIKRRMLELFPNALVLDGFGQTEMAPVTSMKVDANPEEVKERSVGKIIEGVEVKIVDDDGLTVPEGTIGELLYKSLTVMKGYYGDDESTRKVLNAEGWFRSGDLAYRGKDGEIYIVERRGECINSGGEKIFPIEVEEIIVKHPGVDMACVVGVPDEDWGESATAVIVTKPGASVSAEEIIAFCTGKMAGYKKPKRVFFTDSLPLSAVGKVLRVKIKEFAKQKVSEKP